MRTGTFVLALAAVSAGLIGVARQASADDGGVDSGVHTVPTDGGGKLIDASVDDDAGTPVPTSDSSGGCAVVPGEVAGGSFVLVAGVVGAVVAGRRRSRGARGC